MDFEEHLRISNKIKVRGDYRGRGASLGSCLTDYQQLSQVEKKMYRSVIGQLLAMDSGILFCIQTKIHGQMSLNPVT